MELTRKERWLMTLDGKETDRLVFWPKIYNDSYMAAQAEPFKSMSIRQIHDYAGSDIQEFLPACLRFRYKDCGYDEETKNGIMTKLYRTPVGECKSIMRYDVTTDSYHPEQPAIVTGEDIKIMTRYFSDITVEVDKDGLEQSHYAYKLLGERGLAADSISESPLMDFIEWYAGIENGHYLISDYTDELDELFAEMHRVNLESTRLLCEHSPADVLYFIENTSTTIISPSQFEEYCHRHLSEYAAVCKERDRRLIFHMCGHLKQVLPMLADIPFTGIEALSSPPIGNTTFADARAALPKLALIGGTNCLTWIQSPADIIKEIDGCLADLQDYRGIVIGTGGIIPPACAPETLRTVCKYLFEIPMKPSGETI